MLVFQKFQKKKMTIENYILYLYRQKKIFDINKNRVFEDDNDKEKEFVDDYLLKNMVEENKKIYHIKNFSDIDIFLFIIFLIYLFKDFMIMKVKKINGII